MRPGPTFSSRYRRGVLFAPGPGCIAAPLLILPGLFFFRSLVLAAAFAAAAFAVATLLWTANRRMRPALVLDPEGMRLEGLPLTPWRLIETVRRAADALGRPALEVRLREGPAATLRSPLWRPLGRHALVLNTVLLEDSAQAINEAFDYFLRQDRFLHQDR